MNIKTVLVVGLIFSRIHIVAADSTQPNVEQQLIKIEHDWGDSYAKRDPSVAQRITSDDFAFVGPDGNMVNKIDYLEAVTVRRFLPPLTLRI